MIIPDLKRAMTTIMARRAPKTGGTASAPMKAEVSLEEPGVSDGRHEAAQDMLHAFHEKSPQRLMEAMANFIDLHHAAGSENPSEDE